MRVRERERGGGSFIPYWVLDCTEIPWIYFSSPLGSFVAKQHMLFLEKLYFVGGKISSVESRHDYSQILLLNSTAFGALQVAMIS